MSIWIISCRCSSSVQPEPESQKSPTATSSLCPRNCMFFNYMPSSRTYICIYINIYSLHILYIRGYGVYHQEEKTAVAGPCGAWIKKDGRANQVLHCVLEGRKRTTAEELNLKGLEISWERAEELAMDRVEW